MKRIISTLLMSVICFTGITGCSSSPAGNNSQISSTGASSINSEDTGNSSTTEPDIESTADPSSTAESSNPSSSTTSSKAPGTTSSANPNSQIPTNATPQGGAATPQGGATTPQGNNYQPASASLTGTVSFSGSTSVYPAIAALTEAFKKQYPKVKIEITNVTGSSAGLADAKSGNVSFGMRSSAWKTSDGENIAPYQIALDGVAIVVHKDSDLSNITLADLQSIYHGNDFGTIKAAAAVHREDGSGTRTCFQDVLKSSSLTLDAAKFKGTVSPSTQAVESSVEKNTNAIGYMSLGSVDQSRVKKLTVGGVAATDANVINGTYTLSRPFLLLRRSDRAMNAAEKEFLKFALSKDGQKIIDNANFIELSNDQITAELAKVK